MCLRAKAQQRFSKCGTQSSSSSITWEPVRNAYQNLSIWALRLSNLCFNRSQRLFGGRLKLRTIDPGTMYFSWMGKQAIRHRWDGGAGLSGKQWESKALKWQPADLAGCEWACYSTPQWVAWCPAEDKMWGLFQAFLGQVFLLSHYSEDRDPSAWEFR